jgi:hypothetical protein
MIADELDKPASVEWCAIPEFAQIGEVYANGCREFENLRAAIYFVVEELPRQQRPTAQVCTSTGQMLNFSEISLIYRSTHFD